MSIVRCEICERSADLDFEDMVDLADGYAHPDCLPENTLCPECQEHRPDDLRVQSGLKCGQCAYGYGEPISLAPATCADAEESNEKRN